MRLVQASLVALVLVAIGLAGCVSQNPVEPVRNALAGVPLLGPALQPSGPRFGAPVVVDEAFGATEPSLAIDREGRIFVAAPAGISPASGDPLAHAYSGQFWRSDDGGKTFAHLPGIGAAGLYGPSIGGGDSDIAVDAAGGLYAIDLWLGNVGFLTSQNHGDSWLQGSPVTFASGGDDRQWIDVDQKTGQVYVTVNSLATGLWVARSDDHGLTFAQQTLAVATGDRGGCICPPGVLAVDEGSGNVYLPYYLNPGGVGLAVSKDHGATFQLLQLPGSDRAHLAPDGEPGGSFVVAQHDHAGNLYVVYEQDLGAGRRVVLQASRDEGAHWTQPVVVSPLASGLQIFPTLAAGDAGRIAVAWYEQRGQDWNVRLAFTEDALAPTPTFALTTVSATPVLTGSFEREALGDFFEMALDPQGLVHVVWNEKTGEKGRIVEAAQVDGPRLQLGPGPAAQGTPQGPLPVALPPLGR
ncbi:MAG: glycoside hydrolase [Halobacteriales archaeon]|nr:glycoside hydrolase [Halobacteriales archaeon]